MKSEDHKARIILKATFSINICVLILTKISAIICENWGPVVLLSSLIFWAVYNRKKGALFFYYIQTLLSVLLGLYSAYIVYLILSGRNTVYVSQLPFAIMYVLSAIVSIGTFVAVKSIAVKVYLKGK